MRKLNVAITIALSTDPSRTIWVNGGNQHCFFLYMMFKNMPNIANVWLISDIDTDKISPRMFINDAKKDIRPVGDVIGQTDVLIEMGTNIGKQEAETVRARGGKVISYKFGNDYVMAVESCSLKGHPNWVPNPESIAFDEVWTNAQHVTTCASFFKHLYKAPVIVLPHLWSPHFVHAALNDNAETAAKWPYRKGREKKNIAMFEPNINVVKSSIIPMFAAAKFAEDHPDIVNGIYMLNTMGLVEQPLFKHLVLSTKAGRDGIASAEHRYAFVDYAAKYVDIVMSHQWENGLNYHYYEALYGGYPLVHNSPLLREVGYYYPDFDIDAGAEAIALAAQTHDDNLPAYKAAAAAVLEAIDPLVPAVQEQYYDRLVKLFA